MGDPENCGIDRKRTAPASLTGPPPLISSPAHPIPWHVKTHSPTLAHPPHNIISDNTPLLRTTPLIAFLHQHPHPTRTQPTPPTCPYSHTTKLHTTPTCHTYPPTRPELLSTLRHPHRDHAHPQLPSNHPPPTRPRQHYIPLSPLDTSPPKHSPLANSSAAAPLRDLILTPTRLSHKRSTDPCITTPSHADSPYRNITTTTSSARSLVTPTHAHQKHHTTRTDTTGPRPQPPLHRETPPDSTQDDARPSSHPAAPQRPPTKPRRTQPANNTDDTTAPGRSDATPDPQAPTESSLDQPRSTNHLPQNSSLKLRHKPCDSYPEFSARNQTYPTPSSHSTATHPQKSCTTTSVSPLSTPPTTPTLPTPTQVPHARHTITSPLSTP
eukprot:XP_011672027.1 PREDICTED: extensin-like [Strongylocentrotus purpuratus]